MYPPGAIVLRRVRTLPSPPRSVPCPR
eukprot:COSAG01_NODE_18252_length_1089_cov_0.980808_3_plen_26_part_01